MKTSLLALGLASLTASAAAQSYQVVFDNEDTAYSVISGWSLDKSPPTNYLGVYFFSAIGPGTGSNQSVWTIDGIPPGTYDVEFYVKNGDFAADARYIVESEAGTETVIVSQNFVGTGWHPLGTFDFYRQARITQTDFWTGAGTKVAADALRFTLRGEPSTPTQNVVEPEITLVIDDLGNLDPEATGTDTYRLFSQASPNIAYAIIPFLPYSGLVHDIAAQKGIETILHQPMQYIVSDSDGVTHNPGPCDSIRLCRTLSESVLQTRLQTNLNSLMPGLTGVNNHQGSYFSQYEPGMEVVIANLLPQNLYFLDSRTVSDTVGYDVARRRGILTAERDLFIDGNSTQHTVDLIASLALRAKFDPNQTLVGIGHQRFATTPGVINSMAVLEQMGVGVRRLDHNVALVVEADFQPDRSSFSAQGPWQQSQDDFISQEAENGFAMTVTGDEPSTATFTPDLQLGGNYRVFVGFRKHEQNSPTVRATINHLGGAETFVLDQQTDPNRWHYIGTFPFAEGTSEAAVTIDNSLSDPNDVVQADVVKFQYAGALSADHSWKVY